MKRLMTILAATATASALAACEPPAREDPMPEVAEAPVEPPVVEDADAAADSATPAAATTDTHGAPVDNTTLPADKRTSEESVQSDSETLFF